jgi:hypothetical protein
MVVRSGIGIGSRRVGAREIFHLKCKESVYDPYQRSRNCAICNPPSQCLEEARWAYNDAVIKVKKEIPGLFMPMAKWTPRQLLAALGVGGGNDFFIRDGVALW